jgi:hypothetical protein
MVDPTATLYVTGAAVVSLSYALLLIVVIRKILIMTRTHNVVHPSDQCYICYDNTPTTTLLHCGHGGLCHTCAMRVITTDRRCPLCRRPTRGILIFNPPEMMRPLHPPAMQ